MILNCTIGCCPNPLLKKTPKDPTPQKETQKGPDWTKYVRMYVKRECMCIRNLKYVYICEKTKYKCSRPRMNSGLSY